MSSSKSPNLSLVAASESKHARLTRAQAASRLGVSVSTVRRYEGSRLHPAIDEHDVRWFDERQVAALAAELANESRPRAVTTHAEPRSRGDLAAQVFERFEQRQSLAEIVIGLRVEPEVVRALFDQWCLGLVEGHLQSRREPRVPHEHEVARATREQLARSLSELPGGLVRISVGRFRGPFVLDGAHFIDVIELGGFHVSGPCGVEAITGRFGPGDYRITAYDLDAAGLLWEVVVEGL